VRKALVRLLPFVGVCMVFNYLDRVNVGYAALTMNEDLGLSSAAFGFGAGLFFIGYFFFEIPSNLALHKFGAGVWIARIMVAWGILAAATAFVDSKAAFYVVRFLLGVAEAGFFPWIICISRTGSHTGSGRRSCRCSYSRSPCRRSWEGRSRR
jgi:MFS transporter, ACS family, tartrate transporter